jgi:hypothetical protein
MIRLGEQSVSSKVVAISARLFSDFSLGLADSKHSLGSAGLTFHRFSHHEDREDRYLSVSIRVKMRFTSSLSRVA